VTDHAVRAARDVAEVLAIAERHEPGTTRMAGELLRWGLDRHNQAWVVDGPSGVAGALVVTRRCAGRWHATVAVEDPDAGPALAAAVDRSRAWRLVGLAEHVSPVLPRLRRTVRVDSMPFHGSDVPVDGLEEWDPRVREATPADLDALVALYADFEQQDIPTMRRLRRFLRSALDTLPILVGEVDGRVVGAIRCDWSTHRYDFWWAHTVLPEHRGTRLGNGLLFAALVHSGDQGRSICGTVGSANPIRPMETGGWAPFMHLKVHHLQNDWITVRLGPPHRDIAHRMARRAWVTLEGRTGSRR
jgi:hypothetical protein